MSSADPPASERVLSGLSLQIGSTLRKGGRARAIEYAERWHSWAEVAVLADQVVAAIEKGCPSQIRIGLIARNRPVLLAAMLGLISAGYTIVMIHAAQSDERLAADVSDLDLAAVVGEADYWTEQVRMAASDAGTVQIVLPESLDGRVDVRAAASMRSRDHVDPAVAMELLSSGTTGRPKRIPILWRTLELALGTAHGTAMFESDRQELVGVDLPPAISGLSLGNIGGVYMMLPSALIGQPVVMLDRFEVGPWVRAVRTYRPEVLSVQPVGLRMILEAEVPPEDLQSLKTVVSGASHLDPDLKDAFEERYGCRVFGAYGATETCGSIIVWTDELYDRFDAEKPGSVGRPIAGVELRITDPDTGLELPINSTGRLEARVDRVGPDWIRTTDLARIDEDGFVFIAGRMDNAINRGGYKIVPDEVVDVLRLHPAVRDASVVGLPDERLGEIPVAAVEVHETSDCPSEEELRTFARKHLLSYQVPARIVCVDELPRNASLKVMAPQVLALFA